MGRKFEPLACLAGAVALLAMSAAANAVSDEAFEVKTIITVPGKPLTSFDITFVDANIHLLAQADRSNSAVDLVDTNTNTFIKHLTATPPFHGSDAEHGPNGVVIVDQKEIWAGDGLGGAEPLSTLKAIDIATGHTVVMHTNGTGRTDELCEAVSHEIVMAANDRAADQFVTFWSTESHRMLGKISFLPADPTIPRKADPNAKGVVATGGIEQCKFDPRTNKFYLAIPQPSHPAKAGVVVTITAEAPFKVVDVFEIDASTGCDQGPHGLAIGPGHQILLGCGSPSAASLIMDERDGSFPITLKGLSSDEVWYNPGDNHYFLSRDNSLNPVDATGGAEDQPAQSGLGSRTVAADMLKNQVYVVIPPDPTNHICGSHVDSHGHLGSDTQGCIAVYTAKNDDHCLAEGMPVLDHDDGDDPVFMRTRCSDDRRAEREDNESDR
jgi:hypothetical protein